MITPIIIGTSELPTKNDQAKASAAGSLNVISDASNAAMAALPTPALALRPSLPMLWPTLVATALVAQSPANAAGGSNINGWFPCHDTIANQPQVAPQPILPPFECAEVQVPLCHDEICTSNKTIDLFVKRLLAKNPSTPNKAMWFLQGGPGYASTGSTYCSVSWCVFTTRHEY